MAADSVDVELVKRVRNGETAAFEDLVGRHVARLRVYLGSRCRSIEIVDEVSQDTWVKAFAGLGTYDETRPFIGWVIGIARNELKNRVKEQRTHVQGGNAVDALLDVTLIESAKSNEDLLRFLGECLSRMQDRGRTMLMRHHGEGWTLKRLAQAHKTPTSRLAQQLLKLRRSLRKCVESRA